MRRLFGKMLVVKWLDTFTEDLFYGHSVRMKSGELLPFSSFNLVYSESS